MRKPAAASTYPGVAARSTEWLGTWCRRAAGPRPPPQKIQSRRRVSRRELSVQRSPGDCVPLATQSSAPSRVKADSPSLCRPPLPSGREGGRRTRFQGFSSDSTCKGERALKGEPRVPKPPAPAPLPSPDPSLGDFSTLPPLRSEGGRCERGEAPELGVWSQRGPLGLPAFKAGGYRAQPKRLNARK